MDSDIVAPGLPEALGRLRVALDEAFARASREVGLSAQQAELLCAALSPAPVGTLATALRCDRSNVSRLVDRTSARGLMRRARTDDDGRVSLVELTPQGERLARRLISRLESQTEALRSDWPGEREREAVAMLNEVANALEA
jgi:DNA-binding MarR family transcriptional regulator